MIVDAPSVARAAYAAADLEYRCRRCCRAVVWWRGNSREMTIAANSAVCAFVEECTMFARYCFSQRVSLAVGVFLAVSLGIAAAAHTADGRVELKEGDHILFFGDSLTALAGQEAPKQHVTKGYVRIVRETLQEIHKGKGIEVDWVATGGHTVPDLLKRVDRDVIARKPTIVVIQIGCNDARRLSKDVFRLRLEELIDRLKKANIQVIQCTLTSVGEKHDGTNKDDAKLEEFAEIERQVAKAKNVPLNDLRKAFVAHWKNNNPQNKSNGILTYDGNHFNDAGHKFVAE
jgi:lysophospholipase L1-like esterase